MRIFVLAAVLLPALAFSQSKKQLPSFGKIAKEELQVNICEFDKDAEAMVLYESGRLYFDIDNRGLYNELVHHVRIKILSDKGLNHADIKLRYNSYQNSEGIHSLTASTYNLDAAGNIVTTKLDKNLVYRKKITDNISEQAFTMPDVKAGSIIEYKYTWRGFDRRSWHLQKSIPVKYSRYEIDFPSMFELFIQPSCTLPFSSTDGSTSLRTIKQFVMENIPALRDERYMSCNLDYLQKIDSWIVAYTINNKRFPVLKSWPKLAEDMLDSDYIGGQLKKQVSRNDELAVLLNGITDLYRKMVIIHDYVRKNMKWNGIDNYWATSGVKSAWKEKVGTSGDINLILINLLREAGLEVNPLLVSTHDNGRITTLFPDRSQFNKLMAFVSTGERSYVLDAVDKFTPAGMIPYEVMYTEGLLLDPRDPNKFRWQPLWDETRQEKNTVIYNAVINSDGTIKGHTTISSVDYARSKRVRNSEDKEKFRSMFFDLDKFNMNIDSLRFNNKENDTLAFIQEFDFAGQLNSTGEYSFFSTSMFSGLGKNPFIADMRFSDVFYGTTQKYTILSNVKIPDGFIFEELPKNIKLTLEDKSLEISRMLSSSGNIINTRVLVEFKRPFYTPEEYPDLKEFYKKMYELLDEQIVIRKKNNDNAQK